MELQNWIDWAQKQLADMSVRLFRQGYHPARIEYLNETNSDFSYYYQYYLGRINQVMENMGDNPDGYHHFDDFSRAKMELLTFTNQHRERFLDMGLARTA